MRKSLTFIALLGGLLLAPLSAQAHCDAADGPVAQAALKALETGNVNLVLPYAPASAESEITAVFDQARRVGVKDAEARQLAERYFMETAIRLHRQGEGAAYTGLKPAGLDFGPVIPAAERAIESGDSEALVALLTEALETQVRRRLENAAEARALPREPATHADVAAGRARVQAELGFVGYAEGLHLAIKGGVAHGEDGHPE